MQLKNNLDKFIKISSLGQDEILYKHHIDEDGYYLVDADSNAFYVRDNVNAVILDLGLKEVVAFDCGKGSKVNFLTINNTKGAKNIKYFHVFGELNYTCISLNEYFEDLTITLCRENANVSANVISFANGFNSNFIQQIFHPIKNTFSNINNVGVALNNASISFETTGKILKGAAKSNCRQLSRGIIVDDNSKITSKPILLIDEYDCFANHGAAIGKISDDDLFYLMSRGLTKNDAFLLILKGIVAPFLDKVNEVFDSEEIKEEINKEISKLIESD